MAHLYRSSGLDEFSKHGWGVPRPRGVSRVRTQRRRVGARRRAHVLPRVPYMRFELLFYLEPSLPRGGPVPGPVLTSTTIVWSVSRAGATSARGSKPTNPCIDSLSLTPKEYHRTCISGSILIRFDSGFFAR